jgi:hypothetical protein
MIKMTKNQQLTEYIKEVLNSPDNVELSVCDEDNNEKDLSNGIVNVWVGIEPEMTKKELSPTAQRILDALYKGVYVNGTFIEKGLATALRELAAFCQYEMGGKDWHKTVVDVESIYSIANELDGTTYEELK